MTVKEITGRQLDKGQSEKPKFDVSSAVTLFTEQVSTINGLWGTYVSATFAAAVFGYSVGTSVIPVIAVTIGFLTFAYGNARLLIQALSIAWIVEQDIRSAVASDPNIEFKASLEALCATANWPWYSMIFHIIIDVCVIVALWSRILPPF